MADNNLTTKEEFLLNPVEEHNITDAAVASFETNLKHPLKVTVPITPIQDLHGMPNPYPAGASVNLIPDGTDTSNGYVKDKCLDVDGTYMSNTSFYVSEYITIDPSVTYTWSDRVAENDPCICFYDENKAFISGIKESGICVHTFNPPEGAAYARSSQTTEAYQKANPTGAAFQLEVGSTATAYRRYSNICPIEGFASCNISDRFPYVQDNTILYHQSGTGLASPTNIRPITAPGLVFTRDDGSELTIYQGNLILNLDGSSKITDVWDYHILDGVTNRSTGKSDENSFELNIWSKYVTRTTIAVQSSHYEGTTYRTRNTDMRIANATTAGATRINDSTKTDWTYEDFNAWLQTQANSGTPVQVVRLSNWTYTLSVSETIRALAYLGITSVTFPITFTDPSTGDPMTVYGGSLTLNEDGSADLIRQWFKIVINGSYNIGAINSNENRVAFRVAGPSSAPLWPVNGSQKTTGAKANWATESIQYAGHLPSSISPPNHFALSDSYASYHQIGITIPPIENVTEEDIQAYLDANPLEICYPIRKSYQTTYHFPNVGQLKAFLGENNVWSDIGNVNVKYLTQHSETGLEYRGDRALELRRRAMMADAPTIHTTIGSEETGGLASFKSYVKAPVKKIEIPFGPKQDLHGYDHPWPAGGSVNLIPDGTDTENGYIPDVILNVDGTTTTNTNWYASEYFVVDPSVTYTWSNSGASNPSQSASICFYDENKEFISGVCSDGLRSQTFNPPEGAIYCRSSQSKYMIPNSNKMQLEVGSTATPYQRYSNICPIEEYNSSAVVNADTKLFEFGVPKSFTVIQEGSGTPSVNNIRPIKPRISILRDNGSSLNIYQGTITINEDGTSTVVETRGFRLITSASSHLATRTNAGARWQVIYDESPRSTGTLHASKSNALATDNSSGVWNYQSPGSVGTANWSSASRIFIAPPAGITNFTDYYAWLDRVGTLEVLYPLATNITYNLSASETERALQCLTEKAEVFSLTFNQSGDHAFLPIQEGTGDPSFENVRPIHPGLTFTRDDDSVLSVYGGTLTVNENGSSTMASDRFIFTVTGDEEDSQYGKGSVSQGYMQNALCSFSFTDGNGSQNISNAFTVKTGAFTNVPIGGFCFYQSKVWFRLFDKEYNPTIAEIKARIKEIGPLQFVGILEEPISYTLSVTETNRALEALGLTQHIGPLYGGTITINPDGSADVVSNLFLCDLGQLSYSQYGTSEIGNQARCWTGQIPGVKKISSDTDIVLLGCDTYRILSPRSILNSGEDKCIWMYGSINNARLVIRNDDYLISNTYDIASLKASLNGVYGCFIRETPQTYHFSNLEQLKVWLGENNFWCDISDDITVKYWNRG